MNYILPTFFAAWVPSLLFFSVDVKLIAITCVLVLVGYNFYHRARELTFPLLIALLFAMTITSLYTYVYSTDNWYVGTMHYFPLVMWTGGLLLTREVFLWARTRVRFPLIFCLFLYWAILFTLEYLGYYWAGIQTVGGYPSFFNTGVLHGPLAVHLFYPTAGPLYLIVIHYIEMWLRRA